MMRKAIIYVTLAGLLIGCASNIKEARTDFCKFKNLEELVGVYTNLGDEKLSGRVVHLSEVIWLLSNSKATFVHSEIERVQIDSIDNGLTATAISFNGNKNSIDFEKLAKFENGIIELYSDTGFLPDPSGGLVVGPQLTEINLTKECQGNLVMHKHESSKGLLLLFIPVWGELNSYVTFERI